jgi:hypothetical protein
MAFSTKIVLACDGCGGVVEKWTKSESAVWREARFMWGWRKKRGKYLCIHCARERAEEEDRHANQSDS